MNRLCVSGVRSVRPKNGRWLSQSLTAFTLLFACLVFDASINASASISVGFPTNDPLHTPALFVAHPENVLLETVTDAGRRLVAGGEHGVVIVSDDNGETWRQVAVPVDATINQIRFATPEIGWAVGSFGLVLKTQDGGDRWLKQLDGIQAASLMLLSAQQQLAATPDDPVAARRLAHAELFVNDGPDKPFLFIQIDSASHVRVYGAYGIAFETVDGGKTWTDWSHHMDDAEHLHPYGLVQTQHSVVIAGEQGMLLSGPPDGPYQGSFFGVTASPEDGLLTFGLLGNVYASDDNGATWTQVTNPSKSTINCAAITKYGHVLLGDWSGNVSEIVGNTVVTMPINAGFPIADIMEASDQSILLVGTGGIKRVPAPLWRSVAGEY